MSETVDNGASIGNAEAVLATGVVSVTHTAGIVGSPASACACTVHHSASVWHSEAVLASGVVSVTHATLVV